MGHLHGQLASVLRGLCTTRGTSECIHPPYSFHFLLPHPPWPPHPSPCPPSQPCLRPQSSHPCLWLVVRTALRRTLDSSRTLPEHPPWSVPVPLRRRHAHWYQ